MERKHQTCLHLLNSSRWIPSSDTARIKQSEIHRGGAWFTLPTPPPPLQFVRIRTMQLHIGSRDKGERECECCTKAHHHSKYYPTTANKA